MKVTLDNNAIIALEKDEADAFYIKKLVSMHEDKKIHLRLATISASEQQLGGRYASNFEEFQEKITRLGLGHLEMLQHPGHYGMSYYGQATYGDSITIDFERTLHAILFPDIEFEYNSFCLKHGLDTHSSEIDKIWRNRRCDVLGLWSHISYGGNIFVTADGNFRKETKKSRLIALGAGDILTPKEAVTKLEATLA